MTSQVLDLGSGAPKQLLDLTTPVAWRYFFLCTAAGYVLEAFGKSPSEPRDYAACTWRVLLVMTLLASYQQVFGSMVNLCAQVAADVSPALVSAELGADLSAKAKTYWQLQTGSATSSIGSSDPSASPVDAALKSDSMLGSLFFKGTVGLVAVFGLVAHRVILWLAGVLIALCYVVGPLALVFSIPRPSGIGTRWFSMFVSFCTWPVLSGLVVNLVAAVGVHANDSLDKGLQAIAMSLVLFCTAVATPILAHKLVGGTFAQAVSHGLQTVTGLASGAAGVVSAGYASVAPKPSKDEGGNQSPPGGGSGQASPVNRPGGKP